MHGIMPDCRSSGTMYCVFRCVCVYGKSRKRNHDERSEFEVKTSARAAFRPSLSPIAIRLENQNL